MGARNRELETGCQLSLIALIVVACLAGIPPLVVAVSESIVDSRIAAAAPRFACRSCGQVENVREVTLGNADRQNVSTVSGEGFAMFIALLSSKLGDRPVNVKEISVRLQDGSVRVFHEAVASGWNPGDRVKISMGRIKPLS